MLASVNIQSLELKRRSSMYGQLIILIVAIVINPIASAPADNVIPIVSQSQDGPNPDGSYKWSYESGNGIKAQEEGQLENAGTENEAMKAVGEFSYTGDDGVPISLKYDADKDGFKPEGAHIPTPPPIPVLIQKALDWIAAHPSAENQV
ncbi:endocuticle structural glycoprotein SgAbd-8-like [Chelonus insularis]|uniref:endocuticle structural glycoprotein SgAbd-8-like n=1 Tax=Chelonus insularis TaxID=460826 RepID=UPI00158E10F0|nr:endocuticle structural glycoprotein SgAbd-8-like [Chelonus insularis]